MNVKKTHFIFLAVLLVAMMSVAVAADVNDTSDSITTHSVTQYTANTVDTQTVNAEDNTINKKIDTNIKESTQDNPKTIIVDSNNYTNVFGSSGLTSNVNNGDTIDVQGDIATNTMNITIDKAINLTTTTGATICLNTTGGNLFGTNPGNSFKIINSGSYTNVTNLKFYNTQVFVINAHHVTMDNINVTVEDRTVGSGVGVTSIRDNSTYVTVKNSNFYTKNNGGSSSVVLAWADYCTIDNNNITGQGNVGNLMYLTTYNINGTPEYAVDINMYNNITNNNIKAISVTGPCVGVVVTGHDNKFENNIVNVPSSFAGQWMSPTLNETGDHDDRWEGNNYINNEAYGSFTGTKNSTITGNTFHGSVSLPERCIFKNNNAENSTVTVTGKDCYICNNTINHLIVNKAATNTLLCEDELSLINTITDTEENIVYVSHPDSITSNNINSLLNKKSIQQVKSEGETIVIDITESNFAEWFRVTGTVVDLPYANIKQIAKNNTVMNMLYLPENLEQFKINAVGNSLNLSLDFKGLTMHNVYVDIRGINALNLKLVFDEEYNLDGYDCILGKENDNITISVDENYYEGRSGLTSINQQHTLKNSNINAIVPSTSQAYKLISMTKANLINNNITIQEKYSYGENPSLIAIGPKDESGMENVIIENNNITMIGATDEPGQLYAIKSNPAINVQITNNNITVTTTGTANGVELNGNDNTVTDNYIIANDKKGDDAVTVTGENNVVKNNKPSFTITDETYGDFFDDECLLKESYNNTDLKVSGDITGKVFLFDGVNITITNDGTAELKDCQIMVGNDARVVFDGLVINNEDMEAIVLESSGNVINNSEIIVSSAYPLHAVEIAEDGNIITNTIITATIASADVAYDKDYVGLPQSSALYISSNNNLLDNVTVSVDGTSVAEGSYYPSIDAIDFQSTGKGVVIENNTITNSKVIATGSNYVYGINVGRAKDTTIENVNIDVDSDYYTNGIQLFDAVDITIDGTIDSTADTQAYGVYATAMAVGTSSGIDLTGLNITVESPDATGVLIEGASDVIIADATYDIKGGNTTAVNAHVDWMGNIPKNINITGMDINIDGTEDNSILYFGLCDGVTITECNIETTSGSEINFNKTSNAQVTNNYILIKDMMTGSFGNYAVITTENDTTVENNTPTSKLIDELNQQIEDLQNELDQLKAPKATTLTLDPVTDAKYNTNITITGTLVNEDSIGLYNQVVTLTIGEKTVDVTTKGGVFEYTTSFKTLEEQTVTATYAGTDKYNASEDTITFTLEKGDVIVTVDEIAETAYGDNVTITGKFTTSDGKAITNSNVKITINGKKYYAKTDKTGTYTLSVKTTTVGENTITAGYSGNTNYNAYETTATFNVKAADAVVTYEPISDVTLGENVTITGTFTDANGKAVTNSNVKITINGKKYYAKTDSTGKYTLSVATTKEGVNNVTIGYSGSAKYNAFETSTTFTVLKKA